MSEKFKRIYKDLLEEDLTNILVKDIVLGYELYFPEVHIAIAPIFPYFTLIKIRLPIKETIVSRNMKVESPYVTKFTFSVFGRKLYNKVRRKVLTEQKEQLKEDISKTLEILEKPDV